MNIGVVIIKNNEIVASGVHLVVDFDYDEIIEVEPLIAHQSEKFYFDGEALKLKDGKTLLTEDELEEEYERIDETDTSQDE